MSHFTVLVIGENPEEQLAPFQENNMNDCPQEYLKFVDTEKDCLTEYNENSATMWKSPKGELFYTWDKKFKYIKDGDIFDSKQIKPSDYDEVEVFHNERYKTFEEFMTDWHGYTSRDNKTNRYGYWENPNAKWDWYQLGGRFRGFFKLKENSLGFVGDAGVFNNDAEDGWADQVRKCDVDFGYMRNRVRQQASERYDSFHKILNGRDIPNWKEICEKYDNVDFAREEYRNNDVVKDINDSLEFQHYFFNNDMMEFAESKADYVQKEVNGAITTFAIVKDGKWYERGEMGWWAFVSNEKDNDLWNKEFSNLLDSIPDNTLLSVYDCHI